MRIASIILFALVAVCHANNWAVIPDEATAIWLRDQVSYQHSYPNDRIKTVQFGGMHKMEDGTYVVEFDNSVWFLLWDGPKFYDNLPPNLLTQDQKDNLKDAGPFVRSELLAARGEVHEVFKP